MSPKAIKTYACLYSFLFSTFCFFLNQNAKKMSTFIKPIEKIYRLPLL
ncbi:hypothetical protein J507_1324 [Acinetobacter sp. 1295259]|nr:hypothetical protein J507_1324 [Acinetobacter sp. 1295259]